MADVQRFRRLLVRAVPGWLAKGDGGKALWSIGTMFDAFAERSRQALLVRFPGFAPLDSLGAHGRDRKIIRGIDEPAASYAQRLVAWLDEHRVRGNPYALMRQIRAYAQADVRVRTVDRRGNWFTIDRDGTQSVRLAAGNWSWDEGDLSRWSRFWVIIYPTADGEPWAQNAAWGDPALWDTGLWGEPQKTIGTTATQNQVTDIRRIVREWKPDGTRCDGVIIAFDDESFDPNGQEGPPGYAYFDADSAEPAAGELELPAWLQLRCPTTERSVQVSATAVVAGLGVNSPRAFSRDGSSFGLLVEPAATNLVANQDLTTWTDANTPILSAATTPAGTIESVEVEDDNAAAAEYKRLIGVIGTLDNLQNYTASVWSWMLDADDGDGSFAVTKGGTSYLSVGHFTPDSDWTYRTQTAAVSGGSGAGEARAQPRSTPGTAVGAARFWGMQLEQRNYPTSFIGADDATFTRAADVLRAEGTDVLPHGWLDFEIAYRPHYAWDEGGDHNLVYIDADNRFFWQISSSKFVLRVGGVDLLSESVNFSRHQELTLTVSHTAAGRSIAVAGADFGNVEATDTALAAIAVPAWVYFLGSSSGADHGADLRGLTITPGLPSGEYGRWGTLVRGHYVPARIPSARYWRGT
jgi:hypothetical protein